MYIVQRRDSEKAQWHTCSLYGRKCRYENIAEARIAFRKLKNLPENLKVVLRTFRIWDAAENKEVD